jgi:HEAT repeat protein
VNRSVVVSLLPQLDQDPGRQSDVLRSSTPIDLYLIAIGSLNDLVVRHDQRRAAIKALASQADWSTRTLRRTALRARLSRYVRRDRLTAKGWAQAAVGAERLTRLECATRDRRLPAGS